MYGQLLEEFAGRPVVDFEDESNWKGPATAYRLREEYDDEVSIADRLARMLEQPESSRLSALIIGAWSEACEGGGADKIVDALFEAAPRLPELRALFIGEMTYEECEVSWINQTDMAPLLKAFPKLEMLRIRGGTSLSFSSVRHSGLKHLAIESGGLPRSVIREICLCEFPQLEHLELLLGEENYGFDGQAEDFRPLLSGKLFPNLRFLGLMNSAIADDLAAVVVDGSLVTRLETLDLSLGNLTDDGTRVLAKLPACPKLKRVNISHHYASPEAIAELTKAIKAEVVAEDPQEPEDDWRPIVHAE
jgi:hypothetical protein